MEIKLLNELVVAFGLSMPVALLCNRVKIPPVVGFLLTGILAGPFGFGLVSSVHEIEALAEIGVVLLLFTIGAEFSLKKLLEIRSFVLVGGAIQVVFTSLAVCLISIVFGRPFPEAVVLGFLICLSSTALVLKILQDRAEIDSSYGRITFSVLIFQDIAIVPMMLLIPLLADSGSVERESAFYVIGKAIGLISVVFILSRWIVPKVLTAVVKTKSQELFLLSVVVICFLVALITQTAGLSLALGALLAGLVISESEYSHQALGNVIPFQQLFTTLFFVSVGMLLDLQFLVHNFIPILIGTLLVILVKVMMAAPAGLALGFSLKASLLSALSLAQVGEFSFVLAKVGINNKILSGELYQLFLAVSVLSIALTPFIISLAPKIASKVELLPWSDKLKLGWRNIPDSRHLMGHEPLQHHLIIIGFGMNGQSVASAADFASIPWVALDTNPDRVKAERNKGRKVVYGDASQEAVLIEEGVKEARVLVVAIPDPVVARRVVSLARELNSHIHIIVRTRVVEEIDELKQLGADEVVPAEFETAVELLTLTLHRFLVPKNEIDDYTYEIRAGAYQVLRSPKQLASGLSDLELHFPHIDMNSFRVENRSRLIGKTLGDITFRNTYGVTAVAIHREGELISIPTGDTVLQANDIVLFIGEPLDMEHLEEAFRS